MRQWRSTRRTLRQALVLEVPSMWSDELDGVLGPGQERKRQRQDHVHWPQCSREGHVQAHHEFPKLVQLLRTRQSRRQSTSQLTDKELEFPIVLADYCSVQHAPDKQMFTILNILDIALGMMTAISVEEKGLATHVVGGRTSARVRKEGMWSSASMTNPQSVALGGRDIVRRE